MRKEDWERYGQERLDILMSGIESEYPHIEAVLIKSEDMVFEERTKMNCFYCGKYSNNWKCPPNIPTIDYRKMFGEYEYIALLYLQIPLEDSNYDEVREESSIMLHRALLSMEKALWNADNSTALSFIGGSCKLCKNGCGKDKCNNPYSARTPLEATGVNILKTAEKYNINIHFPPKKYMLRIGALCW